MVFSDLFFLFVFIPAFILCYFVAGRVDKLLTRDAKSLVFRNSVLVVFSLVFYAWGEPVYVFLMLGCVLMNYLAGLWIAKADGHRKLALAVGLIGNLAVLGTFKYAGFLAEQLCSVGLDVPVPKIALPIGISFYTFQSISYLIDVYRREARVQHNLWNLLLYISMFPQLIAGPIVRYGTIAEEIHDRRVSMDDVAEGVFRFLIGLGKKVILANQFSTLADGFLKQGLDDLSTAGAWVGILAFTFQIYFDFSGYSDMAIGMGRCMGFHFNENFNHPYISRSITEFWRRWHISLGSFFRDYLYIPLGGNRRHQALNILVVWFLTGMWHGASWNYILWGLYFAVFLLLEKFVIRGRLPKVPAHIYALVVVYLGWILFHFEDFSEMGCVFAGVFGLAGNGFTNLEVHTLFLQNVFLLVFCVIACTNVGQWLRAQLFQIAKRNQAALVVYSALEAITPPLLLLVAAIALSGASYNPFIYFQF